MALQQTVETVLARMLLSSVEKRLSLGGTLPRNSDLYRACLELGHDPDLLRQAATLRVSSKGSQP